jgi:hypothetical protein
MDRCGVHQISKQRQRKTKKREWAEPVVVFNCCTKLALSRKSDSGLTLLTQLKGHVCGIPTANAWKDGKGCASRRATPPPDEIAAACGSNVSFGTCSNVKVKDKGRSQVWPRSTANTLKDKLMTGLGHIHSKRNERQKGLCS